MNHDSQLSTEQCSIAPLPVAALRQQCDPQQFAFTTTDELTDLTEIIGQQRAIEAVQFGIGIRRFLEQQAGTEPTPSDWCDVNNFTEPQQPRYFQLPAGQGVVLRQEVAHLVEELRSAIQSVFESDGFRTRRQAILNELKEQQETVLEQFRQKAEAQGIALLQTPTGFALAPMKGEDDVIAPDEFSQRPGASYGNHFGIARTTSKVDIASAKLGTRQPRKGQTIAHRSHHVCSRAFD